MHKYLVLFAFCSFLWNYSIPERYMRFEKGQKLCGRRTIRLCFLKLARKIGMANARMLTLGALFAGWLMLSTYFLAVHSLFATYGMKVVSITAATLTTMTFCQDMADVYRNFAQWCYSQEDNILFVTRGCWELVLSGLILVNFLVSLT